MIIIMKSACRSIFPMKKIFSLFFVIMIGCSSPTIFTEQKPYIVITFDDAYESQYSHALAILQEFGFPVTSFINSGKIGMEGKCNWQQIEEMANQHNWEIGGHTVNHPFLPDYSLLEVESEIHQDLLNLQEHNLNPKSFALPSGAANGEHLAIILKYYDNIRSSIDIPQFYPIDRTNLGYFSYDSSFTPEIIFSRIIRAVENNEYAVILGFHKIYHDDEGFGSNCPPDEFREIMQWIYYNKFEVITLQELVKK